MGTKKHIYIVAHEEDYSDFLPMEINSPLEQFAIAFTSASASAFIKCSTVNQREMPIVEIGDFEVTRVKVLGENMKIG
ncbi:hypothetical protein OIU76_013788 [Salix suchowensis]|nr:hypothetical protein OIU76_013788 [Salix suchowensis]